MCFSATASFVSAGLTATAGVAALSLAWETRERPLAAMPLLFALQQASEGVVWLGLTGPASAFLTAAPAWLFLLVAEVVWPLYAPAAALLVEPDRNRRRLMALAMALGAVVSACLLTGLAKGPPSVRLVDGHIAYSTGQPFSWAVALAYVAATTLPLLLSSRRAIALLGLIILAGSLTSFALYRAVYQSVWCYFAAAASLVLLTHFAVRRPKAASA